MIESVRLKLAKQEFFSGGGFTASFVPVSVKVKNIALSKSVTVHYTADNNTWKDFPLAFSLHFQDYDIFNGEVNEQVSQFVIRYTVNGETFFDNNSSKNYLLSSSLAVVGKNVILNLATAKIGHQAGGGFVFTTSWLEGQILVNNLSFAKEVGVRMSVDGGITWSDINGFFAGSVTSDGKIIGPAAEVWRFKSPELNFDHSSDEFRFAVFYRNLASGEVFWDNNFGQDYKISKADGSTLQ
jgi:hypothetical protein